MSDLRNAIRDVVQSIVPLDKREELTKSDVLDWINSAAELCRLEKPADPNKHLVSYFVLVDDPYVLLVDHINAGLWLPTGGHVEPLEHLRDFAIREAQEELSMDFEFLISDPLFVTNTTTVGLTAGPTDVAQVMLALGFSSADICSDC